VLGGGGHRTRRRGASASRPSTRRRCRTHSARTCPSFRDAIVDYAIALKASRSVSSPTSM
jgi:hypothetical protein